MCLCSCGTHPLAYHRGKVIHAGKPTRTRPQPPGSEHLWKYCKRCNSWKQRSNEFSKNNRTPDGLQFYCRFCHNRMTKFNQARRLEDQHVAQKQILLANSPEHHLYKPQASRQLAKPGASISVAQHKQQARFDVLGSKVPRQPRTLAMYRKEPAADTLSGDLPDNGCDKNDQHQHTGDDMHHSTGRRDKVKQPHPHAAVKQHSPRVKALPKPALRCQPNPAELMLQANLVLEQLEKVQAQADHRSQGSERHAVSSYGPSLQHSGRRVSSCSQQQRGSPAKPSEVCDSPHCLAVPQPDKPISQEPTSSSTSYVQISMPDSPPAAAAAQTAASAQQPIRADKAAVGQITLTRPLPVQPHHTQHDKAAVTVNGESAHHKIATAATELREADARSSSAVRLESTRSPVFGAAWQGGASQASEQRPRSHASGAHTSANADCATAPSAAASPSGNALGCHTFAVWSWHFQFCIACKTMRRYCATMNGGTDSQNPHCLTTGMRVPIQYCSKDQHTTHNLKCQHCETQHVVALLWAFVWASQLPLLGPTKLALHVTAFLH